MITPYVEICPYQQVLLLPCESLFHCRYKLGVDDGYLFIPAQLMDDFDVLYSPSMFADYMGQDICTVYMPLYDWESMLNLMPFNALTWKLRGLLAQWAQSGAEFLVMEYNRGQGDDE